MSFFARFIFLLLLTSAVTAAFSRDESSTPFSRAELQAGGDGTEWSEAGEFLLARREDPLAIEVIAVMPRRQRELLDRDAEIAWSMAAAWLRSRAGALPVAGSGIEDTAAPVVVIKPWAAVRTATGRQSDP